MARVASFAMRPCMQGSAMISRRSPPRSAVRRSRSSRPRSWAVTATRNSFSARVVVEKLRIDHVGHRGDGVAIAGGEAIYVPYTLGGETVEVAELHGHPDRGKLLAVEAASPDRVPPFCPHFGICGGGAIQHWPENAPRPWKRNLLLRTLNHADL